MHGFFVFYPLTFFYQFRWKISEYMSDYTTKATVELDVNGQKAKQELEQQRKLVKKLEIAMQKPRLLVISQLIFYLKHITTQSFLDCVRLFGVAEGGIFGKFIIWKTNKDAINGVLIP